MSTVALDALHKRYGRAQLVRYEPHAWSITVPGFHVHCGHAEGVLIGYGPTAERAADNLLRYADKSAAIVVGHPCDDECRRAYAATSACAIAVEELRLALFPAPHGVPLEHAVG